MARLCPRLLPWASAFLLLLPLAVSAQQSPGAPRGLPYSSLRRQSLAVRGDTLRLDSLALAPGSLQIAGVADSAYSYWPQRSLLVWKQRPHQDSVRITYRVLPIDFTRRYQHKDRRLVDSNYSLVYHPDAKAGSSGFVDFDQVEYTGSYGRSISLGNNQDVVLNSNFNLQANGYILDSIRLEVALTDNTIPFQPEGNTQTLQEFDQIYIRLQRRRSSLLLGDFNLERPKGYFLNFYKRVQGAYFQSSFRAGRQAENAFGISGSVAKGQFARNIFEGSEGNQGPYKLTGNNGEQFFIVLGGTERVYINGILQERGEGADYIINYNTAEIRFMPRRLITKDSRIQVEFEYQDRNYLNSLIYAWDELQVGKRWNVRFNAYSNQDARNQGYQQNLTGEQKRFLAAIGDSVQQAYYPVISPDTFAANKVLYKLVDTVANGTLYDSVFVYSTNPDSARFTLSFSYVGPGKGDYVISPVNANGRVYQWVAPTGDQRQGDYAPVQLLVTPKMQQVFTLSTTFQIDSLKTLNIEGGLSNTDPNLFSKLDNGTHRGLAGKLRYTELRPLGRRDSLGRRTWAWQNDVSYEYVQDRFRAIAPYRNVEFGRDWNVPQLDVSKPDEHLAGLTTSLRHRALGTLAYSFGYYRRGAIYTGYRNVLGYDLRNERWQGGWALNLLQSADTLQTTQYFRPSLYAAYTLKRLLHTQIGAGYGAERNRITSRYEDTLRPNAFAFDNTTAYIRSGDAQKTRFGLTWTLRRDQLPRGRELVQQSHSHTIDARLGLSAWKDQLITFTGAYRRLLVDDTSFNNQRPEETLLGRLEYTGSALRRMVQWQTLYEFGSGQEQKRSYTYVEVPAGQGLYTWEDYNGDGVQQANEFQLALYPDQKKFIRILTPTNEYVRVNYVNYNQSLVLEPALRWNNRPATFWQRFLGRFSDVASLQISNRLLADEGLDAYNPFIRTLRDDRIIITSNSLSNTLYFNRTNAGWGMDYNFGSTGSKQLLTYGVEGSSGTQHTLKLRWNLNALFTLNITGREAVRGYESALEDGRTYNVRSYTAEPSLTWLYRSVLRVTGSFRYDDRNNEAAYGGETAAIRRADVELRYSRPVTGAIQLRGSYAQIRYDGLVNRPVAFIMLDALQPGANFLWYANWERRVSQGIELSLEYEGRKPGTGTVVHTGRMTVRAIL